MKTLLQPVIWINNIHLLLLLFILWNNILRSNIILIHQPFERQHDVFLAANQCCTGTPR